VDHLCPDHLCSDRTLFKNHENKIREEQEQTSSNNSTHPLNIEEQHRQKVTTEVDKYLSASKLDYEKIHHYGGKHSHSSIPFLELHESTCVHVQQALPQRPQRNYSAQLAILYHHLGQP